MVPGFVLFDMGNPAASNPSPALHAVNVVFMALQRAAEVVRLPPRTVFLARYVMRGVELQLVDNVHPVLLLLALGICRRSRSR